MRKIQMSQVAPMNIHYVFYPLEYFLANHVAWGDGILPLDQFIDQLEQFDYQGYLGLEIYNSKYYLEPEKALEQALNHIRAVIGS